MAKPTLDSTNNKVVVTAPLNMETAALSKAAKALNLPPEDQRQMDLLYMTAIFVSSGTNKNGAVFLGSELVKARNTIKDKAVDIEHDERSLIGQITNSAYLNMEGKVFSAEEAFSNMEVGAMDALDMDIAISAIIHAARFPDIAEEIKRGEWKVSMEAYFKDYDIKVGDFIIPREQADKKGYQNMVGQVVRLKDGNKELGYHLIGRVLRDITFAGVGIVQNPANERSLILEAASLNNYIEENKDSSKVIDLSEFQPLEAASENSPEFNLSELTSIVKTILQEELVVLKKGTTKEESGLLQNHKRPGTCVSFKKEVVALPGDEPGEPGTDLSQYPLYHNPAGPDTYPPGTRIIAENHCALFDRECSARPGNATSPTCWRNVFARTVQDEIHSHAQILKMKRLEEGLEDLQEVMEKAEKLLK